MKIYIYCRISRSNGNSGWSNNSNIQLDECVEYCKKMGWDNLEKIIYDQEKTGWKGGNILNLDEILSEMNSGDILLVHTADRISRNALKGIQFLEDLTNKGCRIISVSEGITYDTNDIYGRFDFRNIINHAELESDRISLRQRRAARFKKVKNRVSATKFQCYNTGKDTNNKKRSHSNNFVELMQDTKMKKIKTRNIMSKKVSQNNLLRRTLERYDVFS